MSKNLWRLSATRTKRQCLDLYLAGVLSERDIARLGFTRDDLRSWARAVEIAERNGWNDLLSQEIVVSTIDS